MTDWTEPAVEELKKLWPKYSCAQISGVLAAKGLGDYSRNAVIGKIHRLDLGVKRKPSEGPRIRTNSTPEGSPAFKVIHAIKRQKKQQKRNSAKFACQAVPGLHPQNVSLLDLAHNGCRWPTTEHLPHLFCNLPQHENSSYCPAHFLRSVGPGTASEQAADKLPKMVA